VSCSFVHTFFVDIVFSFERIIRNEQSNLGPLYFEGFFKLRLPCLTERCIVPMKFLSQRFFGILGEPSRTSIFFPKPMYLHHFFLVRIDPQKHDKEK